MLGLVLLLIHLVKPLHYVCSALWMIPQGGNTDALLSSLIIPKRQKHFRPNMAAEFSLAVYLNDLCSQFCIPKVETTQVFIYFEMFSSFDHGCFLRSTFCLCTLECMKFFNMLQHNNPHYVILMSACDTCLYFFDFYSAVYCLQL
jgi:hypothetical protein